MKTNKIIIAAIWSFFIVSIISCEEQVLDKDPIESFSEKDVWGDIDLVERFVASTYNGLGDWRVGGNYKSLPGLVSDMVLNNTGSGRSHPYNRGNLDPDNLGPWRYTWRDKYQYIRKCNVFLENIDDVEASEEHKIILKGEVKYLRARMYFDLISLWGGVPLITEVFKLDDDFNRIRTPYEEIVDWIVSELDQAKGMVPEERIGDDWGKVNKGACVALKSNVLLYANSNLHDPSTEPNGPLFDYKKNTWQEVADAAMEVIEMPQYELQQVENWKDYADIFLKPNSEMIFVKSYHTEYGSNSARVVYVHSANQFGGWGNNIPIHNLVDAYEMNNGKKISEPESGYNPSPDSIYLNRDMRFYASILYQGAVYKGEEMEYFLPGGAASTDGSEPWNASNSGYNLRKFMDETIEFKSDKGETPWIFLRLAEMYLNYAEAQYMMGNESEAIEYLNLIRRRVKQPDINSSGDELFEDIQHERRIELAFEDHRYYDSHRWMIANEVENEDVLGIRWYKKDDNGNLDPNGKLTYNIIVAQERTYHGKMIYLPIPQDEINKSSIQQNPGY